MISSRSLCTVALVLDSVGPAVLAATCMTARRAAPGRKRIVIASGSGRRIDVRRLAGDHV
jgi:hypothetical protein